MIDLLREGLEGLWAHRVRSLLSTLGILFGVAAVIGILSIGEGARREQQVLIEQLGVRNFQVRVVVPEGLEEEEVKELLRKSRGLSRADRDALVQALPRAVLVGATRTQNVRDIVPPPSDGAPLVVRGADPAWLAGTRLRVREGRQLTELDERDRAPVALLGSLAAEGLFGPEPALGKRVRLGDVWVTVVGVVEERAAGGKVAGVDVQDRRWDVILPLSALLGRFGTIQGDPELSEVQVMVDDQRFVPGQVAIAESLLSRLHRDQKDYELVVPLHLLEQSRAQQRIFNLVMGLIAGISLLVGGIGIMNIMLASVLERTREIGIRLAVGATPTDIRRLFLVEAGLISLAGGLAGILVGLGMSWAVAAFTGWSTAVSLGALVLATVLSMAEGVVFGLLPARQASQLPPLTALRGVD